MLVTKTYINLRGGDMYKLKNNQKGFGVWELLLLLLLILLLILLGLWVWQQGKNNDQAQPASDNQSSSEQQKPEEKQTKYLEIKELGVKVELDDATTDAYYVMQNGYAYVSLSSIKDTDECAAEKTGIVAVSKVSKDEVDPMLDKTYEQHINDGGSGVIIGNNVYLMTRSQAYCSEDAAVQAKQQKAWDSFLAKSKSMQTL